MKKVFGVFCALVILLGSFSSLGSLGVAAASANDDSEELVNVILHSDEDQVIMSQVPKSYEQEYLSKLEDPDFRNAEIQKSLGVNTDTQRSVAKAAPKPFVSYMKYKEVIKVLASMDKSFNWSLYLSNPLTDYLLGKAVAYISKNSVAGFTATTLAWSTSWVMSKQESWWKDSETMILKKKITGVKLTVTPNNTTEYPKAYITLTRY